jgi:hypothetical protein
MPLLLWAWSIVATRPIWPFGPPKNKGLDPLSLPGFHRPISAADGEGPKEVLLRSEGV